MSRISNDDQFHFLISCIRHSNHGKVSILDMVDGIKYKATNGYCIVKRSISPKSPANARLSVGVLRTSGLSSTYHAQKGPEG